MGGKKVGGEVLEAIVTELDKTVTGHRLPSRVAQVMENKYSSWIRRTLYVSLSYGTSFIQLRICLLFVCFCD